MRVWAVVVLAGCGRIGFDPLAAGDARARDGAAPDVRMTSGVWTFVSDQRGVPAGGNGEPIASTDLVSPGDLVVPICRGYTSPMPPTIQLTVAPANAVALAPIIQNYDPGSMYWHAFSWGVVDQSVPANTSVSFTTGTLQGASDCLVNVFRGVTSSGGAPALVDTAVSTGGAGGLVTCGPIASVANGIVIYSAARSACADAPIGTTWFQIDTAFSNPWGAWTPADGTTSSATLTDCGNSGGWICSAISLTP